MARGTGVTQIDGLGKQHHGREQQFLGLPADCRVLVGVAERTLEREPGVVGDRHQHAEIGVARAAAAQRLIN